MSANNSSEQEFVKQLTQIIEANLHNEQFGVSELAREMGMSRVSLHRKIKSTVKISASQFISHVRLKKAFELLKQNSVTVMEVAYECGFNSATYFSKCFHDYYGYTPGEVKNHVTSEKTDETEPLTHELEPARKRTWLKVSIAAVVFLVAVVISSEVFFHLPFEKGIDSNKNTIAILPFVNDSGEEFAPFTAWMGIEIGNKLGKIDNMLVVPQSTTETYRDSKKSNRDIARELMVDHILRGRTIKTGNKILLNVELLDAKTGQSNLTEIYERNLNETEEVTLNRIFDICDDVVFQISESLKTNLTPVEKEQVTKKPTENMAALRAYQEANHHLDLSGINEHINVPLAYEEFMKAKKLFEYAIDIDSTFADAYTMLGHIYVNRLPYYTNIYLADRYLDTGKIYLIKALHFDEKKIEAAGYLRQYYIRKGLLNEADKLLPDTKNRVKNYGYYQGKLTEFYELNDMYHVAEAYLNYMETKPSDMPARNYMTNRAFYNYLYLGFPIRARELNEETLKSVRDTLNYLFRETDWEFTYGSKDSVIAICDQLHKKNPSSLQYLYYRVLFYNLNREYTKALDTALKLEEKVLSVSSSVPPDFEVGGFTYLKNGMNEKADYHFKGSIKRAEDEIKLNSANARRYNSHFNLARIYAILNDKQKSLQYLEMIKQSRSIPLKFINDLKTNPMFDNVHNDPEFQKITRELEKKFLEEHEKIKKLLVSKGIEPA